MENLIFQSKQPKTSDRQAPSPILEVYYPEKHTLYFSLSQNPSLNRSNPIPFLSVVATINTSLFFSVNLVPFFHPRQCISVVIWAFITPSPNPYSPVGTSSTRSRASKLKTWKIKKALGYSIRPLSQATIFCFV